MKKTISIILCVCLIFALSTSAFAADASTVEQTVTALGIMTGDDRGNMNLSKTVTRAEFTKMMIAASVYKDTIEDGSSYSPFKDVKSTHWASGYIKAAVDAKWMTGYSDGTFRPESTITFEEAASAMLKMLGYTSSDLSGSFPGAQISKFRALKLDSGVTPAQGRMLTRNECMYFFYNLMGAATKSGAVYGVTLGYTMNSAGEIDYEELINDDIEGPYVMKNASLSSILPFDTRQAKVYRNNTLSVPGAVGLYDVVYYNTNTKTVWVYSGRAIGTLTAVSPNAVSPSSVTVAGNSYSLETSAAKSKVSATGQFAIGDVVALLLGMNGSVVDVIPASEVDASYCGVVTAIEVATYAVDVSKSTAGYVLTVACTDGVTRQSTVSGKNYSVGNIVTISYAKGETTVKGAGSSNLSGKFSSDGMRLDSLRLSDDVEIMEVLSDGSWTLLYPSRLSGVTLDTGHVRYHALDENQEITRLVLSDVTGDLHKYGVITSAQESAGSGGGTMSVKGIYNYIIEGKAGIHNESAIYGVNSGPAIFYYKNNSISGMKNLTAAQISELSALTATSGSKKFAIADNVQVYLKTGNDYGFTSLSAVNTDTYKLTGYYETIYPAGGQIRVIIAEKR